MSCHVSVGLNSARTVMIVGENFSPVGARLRSLTIRCWFIAHSIQYVGSWSSPVESGWVTMIDPFRSTNLQWDIYPYRTILFYFSPGHGSTACQTNYFCRSKFFIFFPLRTEHSTCSSWFLPFFHKSNSVCSNFWRFLLFRSFFPFLVHIFVELCPLTGFEFSNKNNRHRMLESLECFHWQCVFSWCNLSVNWYIGHVLCVIVYTLDE